MERKTKLSFLLGWACRLYDGFTLSKVLGQGKYFLAIEYISSMGELKRLDFWTWEAGVRILAVNRFRKFIETNAIPQQQKLLTVYTYTGRCRQ